MRRSPSASLALIAVPVPGCTGSRCTSWASTPSSSSVACTCAAVGRPPGEPNTRCTSAATLHPSATAASAPSGSVAPRYERGDRHDEHEQLPEAPHRTGEVGRRDRDDRDDDRHAHRGEAGCVAVDPDHGVEGVQEARVLDDQRADDAGQRPRDHAADGEVARQPPAPHHQRRHHDEAECPQRAECVDQVEQRVELVRESVERGEEVLLELRGAVLVPDGEDEDPDADDQAEPVAGAPPEGLLRRGPERVRAPRVHPRRLGRRRCPDSRGASVVVVIRREASQTEMATGVEPGATEAPRRAAGGGRAWPRSCCTSSGARRWGCDPTASR